MSIITVCYTTPLFPHNNLQSGGVRGGEERFGKIRTMEGTYAQTGSALCYVYTEATCIYVYNLWCPTHTYVSLRKSTIMRLDIPSTVFCDNSNDA